MTEIGIRLPTRHAAQQQVMREHARFNTVVCGRRWGKTTLGIDILVTEPGGALDGNPVAWFAPNSKLFDEVWIEAKRILAPITTRADSQKNRIDLLSGGHIDFWTLHNTDDPGRGRKYAKVAVDEAGIVPPARLERQWTEAIRPTLTDYRGDAWFLSTPKGAGFFEELYKRGQALPDGSFPNPDWRSWQMPTSTNPFIDADEIEAARQELPPLVYQQEYEARFIHEFGAIFKKPALYDPNELPRDAYHEATGCDFAYTSKSGDWTVFVTGRLHESILYVTDLYREQVGATEWAERLRHLPDPFAYIGGQESGITDFLRKDYRINLKTERAVSDKLARAMPAAAAWNRGEIRLPARAPITPTIEAELLAFTGDPKIDQHDDIVDAIAGLHHALVGKPRTDPNRIRAAMGIT